MKNKKKIIFSLLLATSIYSSAFAASTNTFNDLPADHWAYKAVKQLQKDGIISGEDNPFSGKKTVTRQEMAKIVEKAMDHADNANAKQKALISKLASEFALELNNIDTSVNKVEKSTASTFKVGMDTTTLFGTDNPGGNNSSVRGNEEFIWRFRLWLSGDLNDQTKFNARIGTGLQNPGASAFGTTSQNNTIAADRAYLTFSNVLGVDSIRLGRMGINELGGNVIQRTGNDDGIQVTKSLSANTNMRLGAFVGKQQPAAIENFVGDAQELQFASLNTNVNKNLSFSAMYANNRISVTPGTTTVGYDGSKIKGISSVYKMGGLTFLGEYDWISLGNASANAPTSNPRAYALQLTTGKVANTSFFLVPQTLCDMNKKGDSAFTIAYHYLGAGAVPAGHSPWRNLIATSSLNTKAGGAAFVDNAKGWSVDYQYVLMKNVEIDFLYQSLKYADKVGSISRGSKLNDTFSVTINTLF